MGDTRVAGFSAATPRTRLAGRPWIRSLFALALVSTALALGPALAHAFELPNKIGLQRDSYFLVQQIYRGWSTLGFLLFLELGSMIALAVALKGSGAAIRWVLAAILCVVAAQAVFWLFTQPANVATANWTRIPDGWMGLRACWEYSHLAGAVCQFMAFCSLVFSLLNHAMKPA